MPLIGSYTWTEKKNLIKVIIPLKGASPKKVDIFVTSSTLKVNYSPYIVDIVLHSSIDPVKHKATVKDGSLQVTLYKTGKSLGIWGILETSGDKAVINKLREDSIASQDLLEKELGDKRRDRKTDDERYSLRKQMSLDEAERNRLDNC
jgi:dyslexia susceptibility 1 candidate gene 1 protein